MICNKKLLKIGKIIDKIKMGAEKEGTHSKGSHKNITKVLRTLNAPVKINLEKITVVS